MIGTKRNFISLDIGYSGIKAAIGGIQKKSYRINQFIYEPFPVADIEAIDINYIEVKLKNFIDKYKLQGYCVFSMSDNSLSLHGFKLPVMPYDELSEAIKWEISRTLKLDTDEILYDFAICKSSPDGDKNCIYVMTAIVDKFPYVKIANFLRANKLKTLGCDVSFFSDFRFLNSMGCFSSGKAYVMINFGALFTSLSVVYNNSLVFNRRITMNGAMLTRAIRDYCKLSIDESEKYKIEYGLSADVLSDKIIESVNIVNSNCEKIVSDIQYSLKYFSYQGTRSHITSFEKIFIMGGGANLKDFDKFIEERLNIPVEICNFPDNIKIENLILPESISHNFNIFTYGSTALGGLTWSRKNVNWTALNLLPGNLTEGGKKEFISFRTVIKRLFSLFGAALILFAFIIAIFLVESYQKAQIKTLKLALLNKKRQKESIERNNKDLLNLKAKKVKENENLEVEIDVLRKKIEDMKKFQVFGTNPAVFVNEIVKLVPYPDIVLTVISYEGNKVIIRGDAVNNNKVSEFMRKLNDSKYFYNANFDFMEKTADSNDKYEVNFKISVKVKK